MSSRLVRAVIEARVRPTGDPVTLASLRSAVHAAAEELIRSELYLSHADLTAALSAKVPGVLSATLTLGDDADQPLTTTFLRARLSTHVYVCHGDMPASPCGSAGGSSSSDTAADAGERGGAARALRDVARVTELPAGGLERLWERLHFENAVKPALLGYVRAGWMLGKRAVDAGIVGWNGVVLLHGPPGTGKTSLCRALAHKVAVRMGASDAVLVEVRAERLLSKFFSESACRVRELFERIVALAGERAFVVVVLDEVETVGLSRKGRTDGTEPGDAIRVVNALLGGIDAIREVRNCVVVCTSNLLDGIDEALVDRADLKLLIGEPGLKARERILDGVVEELRAKGVVGGGSGGGVAEVARECQGLSGRAMRKLAVMAMALVDAGEDEMPVEEREFLVAVRDAAKLMRARTE